MSSDKDYASDFLYKQREGGGADLGFYEKAVGGDEDAMRRLFEAKGLIEDLRAQERVAEKKHDIATWTQDESEVSIHIPISTKQSGTASALPKGAVKATIERTCVKVTVQGEDLFSVQLWAPVDPSESTWSVEDAKEVVVVVAKARQGEQWEKLAR